MLTDKNNAVGTSIVFSGGHPSVERINERFVAACEAADMEALSTLFFERVRPDDDTVLFCACFSVSNDNVMVLKAIFEKFHSSELDQVNLLGEAASKNSEECFKYLAYELYTPISALRYYNIYDRALEMDKRLGQKALPNRPQPS